MGVCCFAAHPHTICALLTFNLATKRSNEHDQDRYDQNGTRGDAQGGQETDIVDECQNDERNDDTNQNNHVSNDKVIDRFDDFHGCTSSSLVVGIAPASA